MSPQINDYLKRPKRYFNIDGVGELSTGLMAFGFGLLQYLQISNPQGSIWSSTYTFFAFVGVLAAITHYGPRAIKQHITYPRTGYVQYKDDGKARLAAIALAILLAMVTAGALLRSRGGFSTMAALVGLAVAVSYAYGFARAVRWKWFVAIALTLGSLAISALPADVVASWADPTWLNGPFPASVLGRYALMTVFFGFTILVSGAITLTHYLNSTQPPAPEPE
ncbi:MAG TPA: hypothetical protein VGK29_21410 [Paludibaculum sp.]